MFGGIKALGQSKLYDPNIGAVDKAILSGVLGGGSSIAKGIGKTSEGINYVVNQTIDIVTGQSSNDIKRETENAMKTFQTGGAK